MPTIRTVPYALKFFIDILVFQGHTTILDELKRKRNYLQEWTNAILLSDTNNDSDLSKEEYITIAQK